MTSKMPRFFADVKGDKAQAVKANLLSNAGLATAVHPENGQTALQVAVQYAGESVIRALRRHGARWTDVDNTGNNAVHYAAMAGRSDLSKTRKSADWVMALHQPNSDGDTPLHTILSTPETAATAEIIYAFVTVGADINRRNADDKSALDLAEDRIHLVQVMHDAAGAALGNVATASNMGGESALASNSFFGGGGSVVGSVSGNQSHTGGMRRHHGRKGRDESLELGESRASRHRSSSAAGERLPMARSPARRSSSVYPDRSAGGADRSSSGALASRRADDSMGASGNRSSARRSGSSAPRRSTQNSQPDMERQSSQGLAWMGGGQTWGYSDQEHQNKSQPASPASARHRNHSSRPNNNGPGSGGLLRHPAPIRTSIQSREQNGSDCEGNTADASMERNGIFMDGDSRTPIKHDMERSMSMHENGMHAQMDAGAHSAIELDGDSTMHRFSNFSSSRPHRSSGTALQGGRYSSGRGHIMEDESVCAESPPASVLSMQSHRISHSRREQPRSNNTLAQASGSYSAMSSDYDANSNRGEPPLPPGMRSQLRTIRSRRAESCRGQSPRRAPPTPGSVRSVGTANGSTREGRSMHDQVRQMQHALEKAASAMRQLQEDRKADSCELSDFAKCMNAMTERMDIMDSAMQKVADDVAEGGTRADYEARDDIEKLADSMGALEAQAHEMKQWLRDNEDKTGDCWVQLEDLSARVGGETRDGQSDGLAGVIWALEATVAEMKAEIRSIREQQHGGGADEAVQASLAELKEEIQVVRQGQQRTEEQASRALDASKSTPHTGAAVAGLEGMSAEELKETSLKAQAVTHEVHVVREDVEDVKGAMVQMKEYIDGIRDDCGATARRSDVLHIEQGRVREQLTEMASAVNRLQATAPTADSTRQMAREASREASQAAISAAQQTAREVATEVARETAGLAGAEAAQAAIEKESRAQDADIGSLSAASSPKGNMTSEVLERLQMVEQKVDSLEDRVGEEAAGGKVHTITAADVQGVGGSSGGSYSPPRTPDAAAEAREDNDKQSSVDEGVDGAVPAETPSHEREVTASKAMLYTNVYSGPSQNQELSEFSMQLTAVRDVATVASQDIVELRDDVGKLKLQMKDWQGDRLSPMAGPKTLGSGFDDGPNPVQQARLQEIQAVALRADASREETEESLGIMESRLDRAEHNIQLLQHAVHQHDERIAGFMYSPARNAVAEASYALKSTVEALESKIMQVEVQYAGRLQAQKAKNDQQAALIQGLLERVSALEHRGGD